MGQHTSQTCPRDQIRALACPPCTYVAQCAYPNDLQTVVSLLAILTGSRVRHVVVGQSATAPGPVEVQLVEP